MENHEIGEVFIKFGRIYKAIHPINLNVQCYGCVFKKKSKCLSGGLVCSLPPRNFIDVTDEYQEEVTGGERTKTAIVLTVVILMAIIAIVALTFIVAFYTQKSGITPGI